jgi:hypothetical protein
MFAETLQRAIVAGWREFRAQYQGESPYALALIPGQCASCLFFAIATEEGLSAVANDYVRKGYRYQAHDWEHDRIEDELAKWLRWANPDDGWRFREFPEEFRIQQSLAQLVSAGCWGEDAVNFDEFCVDVLASLRGSREWIEVVGEFNVVLGFTQGEDPRDFLCTATRINPFGEVRKLWAEYNAAKQIATLVSPPELDNRR